MADINHVISLGIGSPAAIPEFLTFGLQIGAAAAYSPAPDCRTFVVPEETRTFEVPAEVRTFTIEEEDRTYIVEC